MGSIIHPWNLVMLFVVTSVVVMVHSDDVMDVGSVTDYRPEPRGDDTNKIQQNARSSAEDTKVKRDGQTGEFIFSVHVMNYFYAGTSGNIHFKVEYESGEYWGPYRFICDDFWINQDYNFNITETYYGLDDQIKKLHVKNDESDDFFPDYVIINAPGICDRYKCNWREDCQKIYYKGSQKRYDYEDCPVEYGEIKIPCRLENLNPGC